MVYDLLESEGRGLNQKFISQPIISRQRLVVLAFLYCFLIMLNNLHNEVTVDLILCTKLSA